jgi:hypothetical protein
VAPATRVGGEMTSWSCPAARAGAPGCRMGWLVKERVAPDVFPFGDVVGVGSLGAVVASVPQLCPGRRCLAKRWCR